MVNILSHDFVNAMKFFRMRLRDARKGILLALLLVLVLFVINTAVVFGEMLQFDFMTPLRSHYLLDYSVLLLLLAPLVIAYTCWQDASGANSIYPQTSLSRYLSTLMLSFFLVFLALVVVLVLHALVHLLVALIDTGYANVILGYSFTPAFLAEGFVAALVFLLMMATVISTVSFFVRSFRLYAAVPIFVLALLVLLHALNLLQWNSASHFIGTHLERAVNTIIAPSTLLSFILTCLVLTLVMLLLVGITRLFSPSERKSESISWMLAAVFIPWIAIMFTFGVSLYSGTGSILSPTSARVVYPSEPQSMTLNTWMREGTLIELEHSRSQRNVHPLDVVHHVESHEVTERVILVYSDEFVDMSRRWHTEDWAPLPSPTEGPFFSQKIVFEYTPAKFDKSSAALRELTQPIIHPGLDLVFYADHEGRPVPRFTINYSYEGEGEVLFTPIWSMLGLIEENAENSHPRVKLSLEERQVED